MRRIIIFVGILVQLCVFGVQVKAAGFNEVPWEKYTIVDTISPYYDSVSGQSGYADYNIFVDLPDSMANYCAMHTYAYEYHDGGSGKRKPLPSTKIEAGVIKTNFIVTAPFTVKIFSYGKADLYHWTSSQMNKGSAISEANVLLCIDGVWDIRWLDWYLDPWSSSHPTHYYGGSASLPIASGNLTGMKINCISHVCTASSSYSFCEASATNDFRIDSVIVENVGIEEKLNIKNQKLNIEIRPNPFTQSTVISFSALGAPDNSETAELTIYDIAGKLVKSFHCALTIALRWDGKDNRGQKVKNGIYFIKMEAGEYKVTKKLTILK
ncbi:MAG: FlgD immunoglobulin-like domain containing protein [bacterium]|nr:FlgD immunoglobulin-like domain containing protein [bacterium]